MTATVQINGDQTTVTFTYTRNSSKMNPVLLNAAEYLWDHGYGDHGTEEDPIEFEDLSNQEKLDLLDEHVRNVILDAAKTNYSLSEQEAAREAAATYAEENMDL